MTALGTSELHYRVQTPMIWTVISTPCGDSAPAVLHRFVSDVLSDGLEDSGLVCTDLRERALLVICSH